MFNANTTETSVTFSISESSEEDADAIAELINSESARTGAVLSVTKAEVSAWIRNGLSIVTKSNSGIIGHLSANLWPESGWIELRSSIVKPEFRGQGVASRMAGRMIDHIKDKFGSSMLVTFNNKAGAGKGILRSIGFEETEYGKIPKELFTIGPPYRGKAEFGYKIFTKQL